VSSRPNVCTSARCGCGRQHRRSASFRSFRSIVRLARRALAARRARGRDAAALLAHCRRLAGEQRGAGFASLTAVLIALAASLLADMRALAAAEAGR
jgi:hypothetical protein